MIYCGIENVDLAKAAPCGEHYFGNGKLLLTGEYFVMDGAKALAFPTSVGQSLAVRYRPSFNPKLHWRALECGGEVWFECEMELWHFELLSGPPPVPEVRFLQRVLQQIRKINPHFLRDEVEVVAQTQLSFPRQWGLGSSSTFLYLIAQWANVDPFVLLFRSMEGSGYDIACAQAMGPIIYQIKNGRPEWQSITFCPPFLDDLYFVYLQRKQSSTEGIDYYQQRKIDLSLNKTISQLDFLTNELLKATQLEDFANLMNEHEQIISSSLQMPTVKSRYFADYPYAIKSLGAWGGDFLLALCPDGPSAINRYFAAKGFPVVIPSRELLISQQSSFARKIRLENFTII